MLSLSSLGGLLVAECLFVLSLDLLEVGDVLVEIGMLLESDEELGLLLLAILLSIHGDGLGLDLLEDGIVVSIQKAKGE